MEPVLPGLRWLRKLFQYYRWGIREALRSEWCTKESELGDYMGWGMWRKVGARVTPRFPARGLGTTYWCRKHSRRRCEERDKGLVLATWNLWCPWRCLILWGWSPRTESQESSASRAYGTEVLGTAEITQREHLKSFFLWSWTKQNHTEQSERVSRVPKRFPSGWGQDGAWGYISWAHFPWDLLLTKHQIVLCKQVQYLSLGLNRAIVRF